MCLIGYGKKITEKKTYDNELVPFGKGLPRAFDRREQKTLVWENTMKIVREIVD